MTSEEPGSGRWDERYERTLQLSSGGPASQRLEMGLSWALLAVDLKRAVRGTLVRW